MSKKPHDIEVGDTDGKNSNEEYILKLYITGATPHSMLAVKNITHICEIYLQNQYKLQVIDVYQQPQLAKSESIIATPTLIKLRPGPTRRLIGSLSETAKVLGLLDITPRKV